MKIFKNRFGRQPLWWYPLNWIRIILSIFFKGLRKPKKKKYVARKNVGPQQPKKWAKRDIRPWSPVFLSLALAALTWLLNYQVKIDEDDLRSNSSGNAESVVATTDANSNAASADSETFVISQYTPEQIENLANTIAGRNAIWNGYKGDPDDSRAVRTHFQQQFAKWINSGIIPVDERWFGKSVAFVYAVTDEGVIVFVGAIEGGTLTPEDNPYAYETMSKGITGKIKVTPAQDESGENIIMVYRIRIKFATA